MEYPNFFYFIHKENGGHGSVINYGVHYCVTTKYFKVIDGDDWTSSNELLKLVDHLYRCDDDLVLTNYVRVYKDRLEHVSSNECDANQKKLDGVNVLLHTCTFKTSIFIDNKIFLREKVFYDDVEYVLYPLRYVKTISFCNCFPYYYRLDNPGQSVSQASLIKHYEDLFLITNDVADFLKQIKKDNNIYYVKCLKHAAECLGGYYYVLLLFDLPIRNIKNKLRNNDKQLKNKCPELRTQIKKTNNYSKLFFAFNFMFVGFLKVRKKR